ncbi:MAG TPA: hypothetical protein VN381_05135, partial [Anaerovoracaceae bacterium]|nr:hypothetical protein [Anaerovoracaceae bacterium]
SSCDLGIQRVSERFSGLKEFMRRSDAPDVLYNEYLSISNKVTSANANNIDFDIIKYHAINAMLSATYFYDKFDKAQINSIKQASYAMSQVMDVTPIDAMDTPYALELTVSTERYSCRSFQLYRIYS